MKASPVAPGAELDRILAEVRATPGAELSGLAVVGVQGEEVVYEGYFGHALFDSTGRIGTRPVDRESRFRIASITSFVNFSEVA